jgi:hypothetical protein
LIELVPQINFAAPKVERLGNGAICKKRFVYCVINEFSFALGSYDVGVKKDSQMMGDVGHLDFQQEC